MQLNNIDYNHLKGSGVSRVCRAQAISTNPWEENINFDYLIKILCLRKNWGILLEYPTILILIPILILP